MDMALVVCSTTITRSKEAPTMASMSFSSGLRER